MKGFKENSFGVLTFERKLEISWPVSMHCLLTFLMEQNFRLLIWQGLVFSTLFYLFGIIFAYLNLFLTRVNL